MDTGAIVILINELLNIFIRAEILAEKIGQIAGMSEAEVADALAKARATRESLLKELDED